MSRFLFKTLRRRLTLTYTMVTVLALMALEVILLIVLIAFSGTYTDDKSQYLYDVVSTLVPEARAYLQPEPDLPGLQVWLETLARKGYASLEPQDMFDSPAAAIVPDTPLYVLAPGGEIIAQVPLPAGGAGAEGFTPYSKRVITQALEGEELITNLYVTDEDGDYWLVVPIYQKDHSQPVLGAIVLTVAPVPKRLFSEWISMLGLSLTAGGIMLLALAPFGAIFGYIISRGLSNRLKNLATAAEAWGQGDFTVMPSVDRSNDEISTLSLRMREMVERIQFLIQDQQTLAQLKERNRIAQELHDTVKQQNFATLMQVRAARNLLAEQPEEARKSLVEAESLIKASQQELSAMIAELRPPALEGKGLADALRQYLDNWSQHACIPVTFQASGEPRLALEIERTLYRVAQEGLSNVARHSRATAVVVRLSFDAAQARLEINDNGVGFNPAQSDAAGFGLISMRERLEEIGGRLELNSQGGRGTQLIASAPNERKINHT